MIHLDRLTLEGCIDLLPAAPSSSAPFAVHVVEATSPAAELGRYIERQVFGEVFGNSPELLAAEYDRYDRASLFVLVIDSRRRVPAGALRLIVPSAAGLKSLDDVRRHWGRNPADLLRSAGVELSPATSIWDIATLAVAREYRRPAGRGLVTTALWQAVGVLSNRCRTELLVAIIDVRVLRLLQRRLPGAFEAFTDLEPRDYLDSPASRPIYCRLLLRSDETAGADPDLYALMVEGRGLEAAVAPPDWDHAVEILRSLISGTQGVLAAMPTSSRQATKLRF